MPASEAADGDHAVVAVDAGPVREAEDGLGSMEVGQMVQVGAGE